VDFGSEDARPDSATAWELDRLEREISATDREIDELVYELYDITGDEQALRGRVHRGMKWRTRSF
jgi:hypothetical protein